MDQLVTLIPPPAGQLALTRVNEASTTVLGTAHPPPPPRAGGLGTRMGFV
jgi:hypothetical protein